MDLLKKKLKFANSDAENKSANLSRLNRSHPVSKLYEKTNFDEEWNNASSEVNLGKNTENKVSKKNSII